MARDSQSCAALRVERLDCLLLHRASHITAYDGAIWERLQERIAEHNRRIEHARSRPPRREPPPDPVLADPDRPYPVSGGTAASVSAELQAILGRRAEERRLGE